MQFSEFKYTRPDFEKFSNEYQKLISDLKNSNDKKSTIESVYAINELKNHFDSMKTIANIRYTSNTRDKFYEDERNHFDNIRPKVEALNKKYYETLISLKNKTEIENELGSHLFRIAETVISTYSDEIADDLREESKLVNEYVKIMANADIKIDGKSYNISEIAKFINSPDRKVRENAIKSKWNFFESKSKELDGIYDGLVKIRTAMARKLGFKNYLELGYARMKRTDYNSEDVKKFREAVLKYLVPLSNKLKQKQAKRLGLESLKYYDNGVDFISGNAVPKGDPEWIMEKAGTMYRELSNETGEFIDFMRNKNLLELYAKPGKSPGGYCTFIPDYKAPFIFSNMNGTSDDIRVLTHEAGHAFQAFCSRDFKISEYRNPTLEACEIHSMSMEFLTWDWMNLFFEEDTEKFKYSHLERALNFIPYGVTVDEFQHIIYENPELTPEERKKVWRETEKKYTPYRDYEGINYLESGALWQKQTHIYKLPFYYIDYCLAQICALQYWKKSLENKNETWEDYYNLCKVGGKNNFSELIKIAKLDSPFDERSVKNVVEFCDKYLESIDDSAF
ncbi:MAG TPA: M3 family oligoendopeptidase [Ignavibacteria bacterium]|nr:M3 family oligoendopeptidase [Ignavibacteria bacterium]